MQLSFRTALAITGSLATLAPAIGVATAGMAQAQEPLFLRIRPAGESLTGLGGAATSDDAIARAARARSEAVWQRAEARSRIAIASVCTGCLAPLGPATPPVPVRPEADAPTPIAAGLAAATPPPLAQADAP